MTSEPVEPIEPLEESPFDPDDETPGAVARRPWLPAKPLSQAELDYYAGLPFEIRTFNPWACMWNRMAEDGIGYYSGLGRDQCDVLLADPTKSRYCLSHANKMGVDYYAPVEMSEAVAKETAVNLTRLVPKATRVLELVMDDEDAPHGVRAKAAAEILDRTGYVRGVDVRVDAQIATVNVTEIISDRLNALRDAHEEKLRALKEIMDEEEAAAKAAGFGTGSAEVVPGETIVRNDERPASPDPAGGSGPGGDPS
jgi:hypothetical protein